MWKNLYIDITTAKKEYWFSFISRWTNNWINVIWYSNSNYKTFAERNAEIEQIYLKFWTHVWDKFYANREEERIVKSDYSFVIFASIPKCIPSAARPISRKFWSPWLLILDNLFQAQKYLKWHLFWSCMIFQKGQQLRTDLGYQKHRSWKMNISLFLAPQN